MVGIGRIGLGLVAVVGTSACAATGGVERASVLEFLYPEGTEGAPPADVALHLPVRVGLAFAPSERPYGDRLTEAQKQVLLGRVADAFRGEAGIAGIDVVPSTHLVAGGGFPNLDRLRSMFGIDLMALVSYEQREFDEQNKASLTYWTIVGAYLVPGDDTDTHTFVDTTVVDVPSRAVLFNAGGHSRVQGRSTALEVGADLRERGKHGFDQAFDGMIEQLGVALAGFREQARTGTVRGAGTPAVTVTGEQTGGSGGVAAVGLADGGIALLLAAAAWAERRRRAS